VKTRHDLGDAVTAMPPFPAVDAALSAPPPLALPACPHSLLLPQAPYSKPLTSFLHTRQRRWVVHQVHRYTGGSAPLFTRQSEGQGPASQKLSLPCLTSPHPPDTKTKGTLIQHAHCCTPIKKEALAFDPLSLSSVSPFSVDTRRTNKLSKLLSYINQRQKIHATVCASTKKGSQIVKVRSQITQISDHLNWPVRVHDLDVFVIVGGRQLKVAHLGVAVSDGAKLLQLGGVGCRGEGEERRDEG